MGLALKGSAGFVGAGFCVASDAGDRDCVQGSVECPVADAVEAVPGALAAAGPQGCGSGERVISEQRGLKMPAF